VKNENNNFENETEKDEITINTNGINVHCHVCQSKFKDNLALKEHFEINPSVQFKLQYHTLIISNKTLKKN
jgi:hypothetical protein